MITIYKLIDPESMSTRYVGKTRNLRTRIQAHLCGHLQWVLDLKERGMSPIIEAIECVNDDIAAQREAFWIGRLLSDGHNLVNKQLLPGVGTKKAVHITQETLDAVKLAALMQRKTVQDFVNTALLKAIAKKKEVAK